MKSEQKESCYLKANMSLLWLKINERKKKNTYPNNKLSSHKSIKMSCYGDEIFLHNKPQCYEEELFIPQSLFTTTHYLVGEDTPHRSAATLLISIPTQCLLMSCEEDKQGDIYPVIVLQKENYHIIRNDEVRGPKRWWKPCHSSHFDWNVKSDHGHICWGSWLLPPRHPLHPKPSAISIFLLSILL